MPRPKVDSPPSTLTEAELEIMQLLWRRSSGTVHELLDALPPDRPLAYTTVSTMLRVLEKKRFVVARKQGRQHVYAPTVTRASYQQRHVDKVVEGVFAGNAGALVRQLVSTERVDDKELAEILALIEDRLGR